jgi:hypothetical protein
MWKLRLILFAIGVIGGFRTNAQCTGTTSTAPFDVASMFTPSGYMGDGRVKDAYVLMRNVAPEKGCATPEHKVCEEITYKPGGADRWAGVYWQFPPNNWGDKPGVGVKRASKITFWAVGKIGGEIVEFKAGGNFDGTCKDSFVAGTGPVPLSKRWSPYSIELNGKDLSSVIDAFAWVAKIDENPKGLTFYLDSIRYETGSGAPAKKKSGH